MRAPPHGRLAVRGRHLTGSSQQPIALAGVSLFWSQWMGQFYDEAVVAHLAEAWRADLVRAAVGVHESSGYLFDPETELAKLTRVVDSALRHGIYCIIDWHAHERHTNEACAFFAEAARRFGGNEHVIYEVFNEPLDLPWATVKAYAERVIEAIRKHDPLNLIIVGTPCWSQHVDEAAAAPLADANVAYALHFYAGTHGAELRARAERAMAAGACLFVSEWGAVNADGNGPVAAASVREWLAFLRKHLLSHAAWAVSNKAEGASFLKPDVPARPSEWTENSLTESGRVVRDVLRGWAADAHKPRAGPAAEGSSVDAAVQPSPTGRQLSIEVWWPSDGVTVSGTQPFKLALKGWEGELADVDTYAAWWEGDGGEQNEMGHGVDEGSGCRYKLAMCDVTGWKWRGVPGRHGPFVLTFTTRLKAAGCASVVTTVRTIFAA